MLANHDRQRSEPCNFPPMFQFNSVPSISTIDRKIVSIRERRIFRITNEGGEASSEFYIPFETNTSTFLCIYISWQNRSVNGVDERLENEVKRGISQAEGNNPSEGGHKYRLGGAQNALGVFGTRGLWRYRNNRWPRFATVTPRKPRATFRAYHPDLWIKKRWSPLLPSISTVFARGEKNDSRPVRGFNEAAPPPLDHLFISNILEGKEGNQLIRARLIVFPFLRLSIPSISNSLVCSRSIEKIFRPYILRI